MLVSRLLFVPENYTYFNYGLHFQVKYNIKCCTLLIYFFVQKNYDTPFQNILNNNIVTLIQFRDIQKSKVINHALQKPTTALTQNQSVFTYALNKQRKRYANFDLKIQKAFNIEHFH